MTSYSSISLSHDVIDDLTIDVAKENQHLTFDLMSSLHGALRYLGRLIIEVTSHKVSVINSKSELYRV